MFHMFRISKYHPILCSLPQAGCVILAIIKTVQIIFEVMAYDFPCTLRKPTIYLV